jgi:hypothetical protein
MTGTRESIRSAARYAGAIACGIIAGVWIPSSMETGARLLFPDTVEWSPTFWGEHWVVRPLVTGVSAVAAAFVAGAVARRFGSFIAAVSAFPAFLLWLWVTISAWRESILFTGTETYVSVGNKVAATAIVIAIFPIAWVGGTAGEAFGREKAETFDARRWSLLGVKWYHYLWIPFVVHLVLIQTAAVGLWGLDWMLIAWRSGAAGVGSLLPTAFAAVLLGTLALSYTGLQRAYGILSGTQPDDAGWRAVLKYGVGFPIAAAVAQVVVGFVHYGLARLFGE